MEMAAAAVGMTIGGYIWGAAGKKAAEEAAQAATQDAIRKAAMEAARIAAEQATENMARTVAVSSGVALVAGAAFGAWYRRGGDGAGVTAGPQSEFSGSCCADVDEDNSEFVPKGYDPRPKFQDSHYSELEGAVGTDADMVIIDGDGKEMEEAQIDPPHTPLIKCVVCFELLGDIHVIEPCLHANVCEKCLAKITSALDDGWSGAIPRPKCPSCRVEITSTKRIYQ